jgi:hypothetical protein
MICSSVNRTRFIRPSFLKGRTLNPCGGKSQRQVSEVLRADPNFRPQRLLFAIASYRVSTDIAPEKSLRPYYTIDRRICLFERVSQVTAKRRDR